MKKLRNFTLIIICLYSQVNIGDDKIDPVDIFCGNVEFTAEAVMTSRQKGSSLNKVMKIFNGKLKGPNKIAANAIIISAFKVPITSNNKNKLIDSFTNNWVIACYEKYQYLRSKQ